MKKGGTAARTEGAGMRTLVLALAVAAAGCTDASTTSGSGASADSAPAAVAAASDADAPSLYVDQVVQRMEEGRNPLLEGYRSRLAQCRESGAPTTPIAPDDEAKIGTERWQLWRDGARYAWRTEAWSVQQPDGISRDTMCVFSLQRTGRHGYVDAQRSIEVDLHTGERSEGEGDPAAVLSPASGVDDAGDIEMARSRGFSGPARRTVAGLPCDEWRTPQGDTICIWSGGARWGMGSVADGAFLAVDGLRPDYIVLDAAPPKDGSGDHLETRRALSGQPLDPDDMLPRQ